VGDDRRPAERTPDDFARWLDRALDEAGRGVAVPFATLEAPTRRPIASTRYGTLRPEHR
jgi:hypothetical protein